jgi:hypothetical protein
MYGPRHLHPKRPKGRDFWGAAEWRGIHSKAATYTPNRRDAFLSYIYSLPDLLPCEKCGNHLKENLKALPPEKYMTDNHTLFFWSYALHDMVNQQHNRYYPNEPKKVSPPLEHIKAEYFSALSDECVVCR